MFLRREYLLIFLWVHLISQFLMWMDEGYYDFRWMADGWNWVVYVVYTTIIFGCAAGCYRFAFRNKRRAALAIGVSVFLGFFTMTVLLLALWYGKGSG